MIDLTQEATLDRLAELLADRITAKLQAQQSQVLVSREELAAITGLGKRTIDRMGNGGSWEKDKSKNKVWRESAIKLDPIRNGGRVLFDKAAALAAIKAGSPG